ncbi:MAG: ABC transporter permease, partial [Marinicaulis sp.]|nr:ABC transporter permease [Marinicaulis sp.]
MTNVSITPAKSTTKNVGFRFGVGVSAIFIAAALISNFWTPYTVDGFKIAERFASPSFAHWFGANHLGRDVLSMIMIGARISIGVAATAIFIGMTIGVPLGLFAAAYGGIVDGFIMRAGDLVFAFPAILLAILIAAVYGPSAMNAVIAIGVFNIPVFARVTRGAALSLWKRDYILAARMADRNRVQISIE